MTNRDRKSLYSFILACMSSSFTIIALYASTYASPGDLICISRGTFTFLFALFSIIFGLAARFLGMLMRGHD